MAYLSSLPSDWQTVLNSNVISDLIYVELIYDPDGDAVNLNYKILQNDGFGSINAKKNVYPDDRLNSWSIDDIEIRLENFDGYFNAKTSDTDTDHFLDKVLSRGKKVLARLRCDACVDPIPLGYYYIDKLPQQNPDGSANWTLSSQEKELAVRNLFARTLNIYDHVNVVFPNKYLKSSIDYSQITREGFVNNDDLNGADLTNPYRSLGLFPQIYIGSYCPIGTWTIEFINGKKQRPDGTVLSSSDDDYDDSTEYVLKAPDGKETQHSGLWSAIDNFDTLSKRIYENDNEDSDYHVTNAPGFKLLSLDTNKIYFTFQSGLYFDAADELKNKVVFHGKGSLDGIIKGKEYKISAAGWNGTLQTNYIEVSGITPTNLQGKIYVSMVEDTTRIFSNRIWAVNNLNFENIRLQIACLGEVRSAYKTVSSVHSVNKINTSTTHNFKSGDWIMLKSDDGGITGISLNQWYQVYTTPDVDEITLFGIESVSGLTGTVTVHKLQTFKEGDQITFKTSFIPKPSDPNQKKFRAGDLIMDLLSGSGGFFPEDFTDAEISYYNNPPSFAVQPSGGLDDLESSLNTQIDYDTLVSMNSFFNNLNFMHVFDQDVKVWDAIQVVCKQVNITAKVDREGRYSFATYRPKVVLSIEKMAFDTSLISVTKKDFGYFATIRANYDYIDGQYTNSKSLNTRSSNPNKIQEPILDLYLHGVYSKIFSTAFIDTILRRFAAMWSNGLYGFDIELKWNLTSQIDVDDHYRLQSLLPEIDTEIEIISASKNLQGINKSVTAEAFDSDFTFGDYAVYGECILNSGKVYW